MGGHVQYKSSTRSIERRLEGQVPQPLKKWSTARASGFAVVAVVFMVWLF